MALFTALIVVVGYSLVHVPNIELVTATAFLAGTVLGPYRGAVVGGVGELLYALVNPLGISALPLLISQVIGITLVGFAGGLVINMAAVKRQNTTQLLVFALCGISLTLLFDILTTCGFLIMSGITLKTFSAAYAYGAPFYIVHVMVNTIIFVLLLPLLYRKAVQILSTNYTD